MGYSEDFIQQPYPRVPSEGPAHIGMDTKYEREGLHLWISHGDGLSLSVHLTREDARNLVKQIRDRLF